MKLVWLINIILPRIAEKQGKKKEVIAGWVVQLSEMLADDPETDFTVFYPQHDTKENVTGNAGNLRYVGFYEEAIPELSYNPDMTSRMKSELDRIGPDVLHIWGSEFVHTLSMVRAFGRPERTVISVQGLIYYWGLKYDLGLPERIISRHTFRDFIRQDSIRQQKEKFLKRGECEIAAIKEVRHVIGRTEWDKRTSAEVNPELIYHHAGEILRKEFYDNGNRWNPGNVEPHRMFMSQSYYPIKGIHFAIRALSVLRSDYPDIKLVVTGKDMRPKSFMDRIKQDSFGKYVCDLIRSEGLDDHIVFPGPLDASEMIRQYLRCNVFLLPSVMENSSNSLGEAMILGVPCVAAATGGTPDMMREDEGWLYDCTDTEELVRVISDVFKLTDRARNETDTVLSETLDRAVKHAEECYDIRRNGEVYRQIYERISEQ